MKGFGPHPSALVPLALTCLCLRSFAAQTPAWTTQTPQDPAFYFGVGLCEKKGLAKDQYRKNAEDRALADLAAKICVDIQSEFMQKVTEVTGMPKEEVQSTIHATTQAHLAGHEPVGTWEDRHEFWVCYRLSKALYAERLAGRMTVGVAQAEDMLVKAQNETRRDPVNALKFYLDALEKLGDLIGQPTPAGFAGRDPLLLSNALFTDAQSLLSRFQLAPLRATAPVLAGAPLHEVVLASLRPAASGATLLPLPNLPVQFALAAGLSKLNAQGQTDAAGQVACHADAIDRADAGKTVIARIDLLRLYPAASAGGFAQRMREGLTVPETRFVLFGCADEADYRWRCEFQGRKVVVLCAYEAGGKTAEWTKLRDAIGTFVQGRGGTVVAAPAAVTPAVAVAWSASPESVWEADKEGDLLVIACAASGQLNKRKSAGGSSGEDVQFAGDIRIATHYSGRPGFSDRFSGTGGWNPMGERMCMDVLALNVTKHWQNQYLAYLGKMPEGREFAP